MSRLVALYPAAWRARYESELRDALTFRPLTMRGRLDLVRGAVDARLHPELAGSPAGAPVPVGPDTGGGIPMPRAGLPWTAFLGVTATLGFALSALLLLVDTWFIGGEPFPSTLLVMGAAALGAAAWRTSPKGPLRWAAAAVLVGIGICLFAVGWPSAGFSAVILVVTGTLMVAAWSFLVGIRERRWFPAVRGLGLIVLALVLGYSFLFDAVRGMSLAFAAFALISLRLATPELTRRRASMGILGGVLLVGLVSLASMATSPWHTHDGYALACHSEQAARCSVIADHFAARVRSENPSATVTHIEVFADAHAELCWTAPEDSDRGCWHTSPY